MYFLSLLVSIEHKFVFRYKCLAKISKTVITINPFIVSRIVRLKSKAYTADICILCFCFILFIILETQNSLDSWAEEQNTAEWLNCPKKILLLQ